MATRYWVGGTGDWDAATTHWSATSGGAGGVSVPTSVDDVIFDSSSNGSSYTVTIPSSVSANSANLTMGQPATGVLTLAAAVANNGNIFIFGNVDIASGVVMTYSGTITLSATSGTKTITTNSVVLPRLTINGVGGTFQLLDTLNVVGNLSITNGTFDASGASFEVFSFSTGAGTSVITLGTFTYLINGSTFLLNTGTVTFNAGASTIKMTNNTGLSFAFQGGGKTFNNVWFDRGTETADIQIGGNNIFNDFKDTGSVAHNLTFASGNTQTFNTFSVSGTAGNLITIKPTSGTATYALVKAGGGVVSSDYLNIQHSVATPGTTWYAGVNSVNNQATTTAGSGWIFTAPPVPLASLTNIQEISNIISITI